MYKLYTSVDRCEVSRSNLPTHTCPRPPDRQVLKKRKQKGTVTFNIYVNANKPVTRSGGREVAAYRTVPHRNRNRNRNLLR